MRYPWLVFSFFLCVGVGLSSGSGHACLGTVAEPIQPDQPITLFNGEDLDGWAGDSEVWEADEGVIRTRPGAVGLLQTEASYTDYILHLEWRWPQQAGDSGVFLHIGPGQGTGRWPNCIETQLYNGRAGDFWLLGVGLVPFDSDTDERQQNGRVTRNDGVQEAPLGEWNSMTILCEGGFIEVTINGEVANAGFDASRTSGPIGLQAEGGQIEFRNLRLTPLE